MKQPGKHFTRIVVWSISSSLMASSCTNFVLEDDIALYASQETSQDDGISARNVHLSSSQTSSYRNMMKLADQIIRD